MAASLVSAKAKIAAVDTPEDLHVGTTGDTNFSVTVINNHPSNPMTIKMSVGQVTVTHTEQLLVPDNKSIPALGDLTVTGQTLIGAEIIVIEANSTDAHFIMNGRRDA